MANVLSPADVASAYRIVTSVVPPVGLMPGWEIETRALLCSVHPKLLDILAICAVPGGPAWDRAWSEVQQQREARSTLYQWILQLDKRLAREPSFVFPDPYSLLLWMWTFQLFGAVRPQPGGKWNKFFYRGEERDYGNSRFTPTMARTDPSARGQRSNLSNTRYALVGNASVRAACTGTLGLQLGDHLLRCMSVSQALAISQHYGQSTPLLDMTTNPEVAMYFATRRHESEVGVIGFWRHSGRRDHGENIALIMAPPGFERLHRQSGYFICVAPTTSGVFPFSALRFHHCPELEPIRPKWLASVGECEGSDDEILGDPWNLSEVLASTKIRSDPDAPAQASQSRNSRAEDLDRLVRIAVSSIGSGAGRLGVDTRGRFMEIQPTLLYSLFRFAPAHFLTFTKVITLFSRDSRSISLQPIADKLIEVLRGVASLELRDISDDDDLIDFLTDLFIETERQSYAEALPWPVSAWYV
jgi:hypothetical protein